MTEQGVITMLEEVVKALERRFPDHNRPFEYGTRLAEEVGELIEVIYEIKDGLVSESQKDHLTKELQDVLRIAYGIAGLYDLTNKLPRTLADFSDKQNPNDTNEYIAQIAIGAGELANAINHAEGMGVKKEKHGDESAGRVFEKSYELIQVIVWAVRFFECEDMLLDQIADSYGDYKAKGFIL